MMQSTGEEMGSLLPHLLFCPVAAVLLLQNSDVTPKEGTWEGSWAANFPVVFPERTCLLQQELVSRAVCLAGPSQCGACAVSHFR